MATDGVRKIIEQIEKSAAEAESAGMAEAQEKVDARLGEARRQAEQKKQAILARAGQEARRESQRILAEARIKARREKVRAQESVVQKSFDTAMDTLRSLAEQGSADGISYAGVLERLISESVVSSGETDLEVMVPRRDRQLVGQDLLDRIAGQAGGRTGTQIRLRISEESLSSMGGVAVRSSSGTVRVDNTFESRIDRFRDEIRTHVAKELFSRES